MSFSLHSPTLYPQLVKKSIKKQPFLRLSRPIQCIQNKIPIKPNNITHLTRQKTHVRDPLIVIKKKDEEKDSTNPILGMSTLCGFGYWVQGFRCFPWLALNFHMAHNLHLSPSTLQLVQNSGMLPMVAKPLYGVLSDVLYIGGAHRLPYISIGELISKMAFLMFGSGTILSWGSLAVFPVAGEALPILMSCVLLSNLGASITEVAKDALVAEYGKKNKMNGLQSYAFMALAVGGVLGNLLGGFFLLKAHQNRFMFLVFTSLLSLQLALSLTTSEKSLGLPKLTNKKGGKSVFESIRKQYSDLMLAISEVGISQPLFWVVASIAMVPNLSCSIFCYQTQCLNLDPSVIGMSRVVGQLMLLSMTLLYDRFWKNISMRKLIGTVQILYASSLLLDLILVKQLNLKVGIPNDIFVLCFSGVAEAIAQFKLLPFQVLFASLAPPGCEGSLMSFLASAFCLSSIVSGFLGIGLASVVGISSGDYSSLPMGMGIQFLAALVPLYWIRSMSNSEALAGKDKKVFKSKSKSKRRRRYRRLGRLVLAKIYAFRRERESEPQKR